jgi:glutamate 5-kinase
MPARMVIASGGCPSAAGHRRRARCTWFLTPANPVTARKKWIAGSLEPKGILTIDAGAVAALRRGRACCRRGHPHRRQRFARGDAVVIRVPTAPRSCGLVAYDIEDAAKIGGVVGRHPLHPRLWRRSEMVHRDDRSYGSTAPAERDRGPHRLAPSRAAITFALSTG